MQLDYLKYIIAIKEWGSINKAAEHLYVSQQHISKVISKLEKTLQRRFFVRTAGGMALTQDGERLYQYALDYEEKRRQLEEIITAKYLKDIKGSIRIGAMSTGSTMILPQMLCTYYHDYPNITINVIDGNAVQMIDYVLNGTVDMAIALITRVKGEDYPQVPAELKMRELGRGRLCYWVSAKSPLARLSEVDIAEVVNYPVIMQASSDFEMLTFIYGHFGKQPKIAADTENPYLMRKLTADDFGICPDIAMENDQYMLRYIFEGQEDVRCVPVYATEQYVSRLYLIDDERKSKNLLQQHVLNFLLSNRWKV